MSRIALTLLLVVLALIPAAAQTPGPTGLRVFGDSLSDIGNINALTFGLIPGSPYFGGRFSDGPLWVEGLAAGLSLPITPNGSNPNNLNGNDHAFGGSRAAGDTTYLIFIVVPGIENQVNGYVANAAPLDPDVLYVVASGANDVRDAADGLTPGQQTVAIQDAVAGIDNAIRTLVSNGARHVLVLNSPDIGRTPEAIIVRNNAALATQLSISFNTQLDTLVDLLRLQLGVRIIEVDLFGLIVDVFDDALNNGGAVYGITNVTTPIFAGFAGSPGANPATSLFADDLHPSAVAHGILANVALDAIAASPLPGSNEDLAVSAEINGVGTPLSVASALAPGDVFGFGYATPGSTYTGDAGLLLAQGFPAGSPPAFIGFPELWVDTNGILLDTILLSPTPALLAGTTPPGLTGLVLRLQMIVLDNAAANGIFAASDGVDMRFL